MSVRRLEKVSRLIRNSVSEVIQGQISDPRIRGLISVTRVEPSADLRYARVYLSVLGVSRHEQALTLKGVQHAAGFVQSRLSRRLAMKTCPTLQFFLDDSLKKGSQITKLLDQIAAENLDEQEKV